MAGATGIKDRIAIVGVGNTDYGAMYRDLDRERSPYELAADAMKAALEDSGLDKRDIDGLITIRLPDYRRMADVLGMDQLRLVNGLEATGRMAGVALQYAMSAIYAGQAETVAIVYGNTGRSGGARYGGEYSPDARDVWDAMYGMTSPGAAIGNMWRRYMYTYGAPEDSLAAIAINNRKNAALNPVAIMRRPITREEYLESRYVTEPFRLFDYCLINDGGAATIVTTAERAKTLRQPPVYIGASFSTANVSSYTTKHDFFYGPLKDVADRLFKVAGVTHADIDVAQLYDNFTSNQIFALEGLGFCERGTGWQWVQDGRIELGGELPVNTNGGHTSEGYMQGHGLTIELVRQLRGECGERQVPDAKVGLYACPTPICTAHILHT